MKEIGDLISESWKEYKGNFGLFAKIFLLLGLIPTLGGLIFEFIVQRNVDLVPFFTSGSFDGLWGIIGGALGISLVIFLLNFLMMVSYFYIAFYKDKSPNMSLGEALKGGMNHFWKFLGLSIVMGLLLLLLTLLFIIPGIIFAVFWIFSFYVLIREKTSIGESLKRSKKIVKGKWWTVFGNFFVFGLLTMVISLIFSLPELIFQNRELEYSLGNALLKIVSYLAAIIVTPFGILFGKNFYLDLRKGVKK